MSGDPESGGGGGTPKSLESMTPPSATVAAAAAGGGDPGVPLSEAKLMSLDEADRRALACHGCVFGVWCHQNIYRIVSG